jgi:hypothetical protein
MKKVIYGFAVILIAAFVIPACNKFGDTLGQNGQLVASKYKVKINEPDSLVLVGAKSTDSLKWSVIPSGYDSLTSKKNTAVVVFKKGGSYQVQVTENGIVLSKSITVSDSIYHPAPHYITTPLTGDQITLVPHYTHSADSTYLYFVAQTKNHYCATSNIVVADSLISGIYGINLIDVVQPSTCVIGQGSIAKVINFKQNLPVQLQTGTFPLSVTLNGTTYTGSVIVSVTTITFNWNYSAGVLIAPKQISR